MEEATVGPTSLLEAAEEVTVARVEDSLPVAGLTSLEEVGAGAEVAAVLEVVGAGTGAEPVVDSGEATLLLSDGAGTVAVDSTVLVVGTVTVESVPELCVP